MKDRVISLSKGEYLPFLADRKDTRLLPSEGRAIHFQKDFDEQHKVKEILFQDGAMRINDLPFRKHNTKSKSR